MSRKNFWSYAVMPILFTLPFLAWGGTRLVQGIVFDINCGDRIKRAADANTVEMAITELEAVLAYTEANGLTQGYTSVLYRGPADDVGFWYNNLKSALNELKKVTPATTQLERTNILIKLRETLLDHREGGDKVTLPPGIALYPNNIGYAWWGILSLLVALGLWSLAIFHAISDGVLR